MLLKRNVYCGVEERIVIRFGECDGILFISDFNLLNYFFFLESLCSCQFIIYFKIDLDLGGLNI